MPVKRKRNNLPFARKCHERSDMGCAQALSFDISILSCGNRFGVYSACLCTTVGQRYNSVEFTADSGRFPVFTELWVFCSLHNRGAMVSFRNDFCGLGAVSAAAQALWLDCAGDPGSNPADTGRDPAELWFTGCPMYTSVWLG